MDDQAKADTTYNEGRIYPEALKAFQVSGKQYAVPSTFSDVVLFHNKKLFDAAGVAYPTNSWTWADETAAAAKLTNKVGWRPRQLPADLVLRVLQGARPVRRLVPVRRRQKATLSCWRPARRRSREASTDQAGARSVTVHELLGVPPYLD